MRKYSIYVLLHQWESDVAFDDTNTVGGPIQGTLGCPPRLFDRIQLDLEVPVLSLASDGIVAGPLTKDTPSITCVDGPGKSQL